MGLWARIQLLLVLPVLVFLRGNETKEMGRKCQGGHADVYPPPQRDTRGPQVLKRSRLGSTCRTATKRLLSFGLNTEAESLFCPSFWVWWICDNYIISKKNKIKKGVTIIVLVHSLYNILEHWRKMWNIY